MLDILRMAKAHHIPFIQGGHTHSRPNWIQLECPFCGSSGTHGGWYLGFALESGTFNCWRCGKLDFWDTLIALLKKDRAQVGQIVHEFQTGKSRRIRAEVIRPRTPKPLPGTMPLAEPHKKYLRSRNFDPHHLEEEWGLTGTGALGGVWSWRVIIPIFNEENILIARQGRSIGTAQPKYKMMDTKDCLEDPKTLLYGIHKALADAVIVVEGATSVWRLGPGTVATFGIDWKMSQANRLRRFSRRFILFDPEPKAQERAAELARCLSLFPGETEVLSGFNCQPGEFSPAQVKRIRRELGLPPLERSLL